MMSSRLSPVISDNRDLSVPPQHEVVITPAGPSLSDPAQPQGINLGTREKRDQRPSKTLLGIASTR